MHVNVGHFWYEARRHQITDQKGLRITSFLREMAVSLIGVFSIVFVFGLGQEKFGPKGVVGGLLLVLLYLLTIRMTISVLVIWLGNWVIRVIGYRKSVLVSLAIQSFAYSLMSLAAKQRSVELVLVAAFLIGLVIPLYWITYFTLFADSAKIKKVGASFGLLNLATSAGQIVAPLVGALIVLQFGYDRLFVSGIGLLVLSGVPMLFLKHHLHLDRVSWREFFQWASETTFIRAGLSFGGRMINDAMLADLWPVYVFLLIGGVGNLGVFQSAVLLAGAVFTVIVAKVFDHSRRKLYQVMGVVGGIVAWMARLWVGSLGQVVAVDSIDRFFLATSKTFFFGYLFRRAHGPQLFSFLVYWEMWQSFWVSMTYGALILVLLLFSVSVFWYWVVGFGVIGLVLSLLIQEHHRKS